MSDIAISIVAQTKMALHAAKHGFSNPIHGIVLGKSKGDGSVEVVDVVPVCHEVPTKPIVDMALRLADAHLQQQNDGARIVGWYTANANAASADEEMPNASACRIASSVAGNANDDDGGSEDFFLILVSTAGITERTTMPICSVFEKDKSRTFTQKVDGSRIINTGGDGASLDKVISGAIDQLSSSDYECDAAGGGAKGSLSIHDYVDHLENCGEGNWIENGMVNDFVVGILRS